MSWRGWLLFAGAIAASAGCHQPGVLVGVDTADGQPIAGVAKLTATVNVGAETDTVDIKDRDGHFMIPPPRQLFELLFAADRRGLDATLLVEAVAADGKPLAGQEVPFNTGQTGTVEVRLGAAGAGDLGLACTSDAGETDVGCGGPACPPCSVDKMCAQNSDCTTGSCVQGRCARVELSWVAVSPLPAPRSNLAAVQTSDGGLWALGGFSKNATPQQRADVDRYDPFTDVWTVEASLQKPRSGLCAAPLPNGAIVAAGGYIDATAVATNTVEYYDPVAGKWTLGSQKLNQGRSSAALAAYSGGLMILGGEADNFGAVASLASVENQPSPGAAGAWTSGSAMSRGLELTAALVFGGSVFILGGNSTTDGNAWETHVSAWSGQSWMDRPQSLTTGRNGHAAAVAADGRIFVVGGNVSPGVVTGSVETYDAALDRWAPMASQLRARDRLAAALGPDGRVYAIGGSNNGVEVAYVDAYGPTIALSPAAPAAGAAVAATGAHFAPNAPVTLTLDGAPIGSGVADASGALSAVTFSAPAAGAHAVGAMDDFSLYPITHPLVTH